MNRWKPVVVVGWLVVSGCTVDEEAAAPPAVEPAESIANTEPRLVEARRLADGWWFRVGLGGAEREVVIRRTESVGWRATIDDGQGGFGFGLATRAVGDVRRIEEFTARDTCAITWRGGESPIHEVYEIRGAEYGQLAVASSSPERVASVVGRAHSLRANADGRHLMRFLASATFAEFVDGRRDPMQVPDCPFSDFCQLAKCRAVDLDNPLCADCYGIAACVVEMLDP